MSKKKRHFFFQRQITHEHKERWRRTSQQYFYLLAWSFVQNNKQQTAKNICAEGTAAITKEKHHWRLQPGCIYDLGNSKISKIILNNDSIHFKQLFKKWNFKWTWEQAMCVFFFIERNTITNLLDRKTSRSTFLGSRAERFLFTVCPAVEKTRSDRKHKQ